MAVQQMLPHLAVAAVVPTMKEVRREQLHLDLHQMSLALLVHQQLSSTRLLQISPPMVKQVESEKEVFVTDHLLHIPVGVAVEAVVLRQLVQLRLNPAQ
jgi:F0F1-type ATP synthase beta subunit